MNDTKDRILDAAEQSFAEHGFTGTSVRKVIADAGVNLAAVHYHFGSKQELLRAVLMRRAEPVNQERLAMLDEVERRACPAPLEQILEAFIVPTLRIAGEPGGDRFVRLMGRLYAESDLLPRIVKSSFHALFDRFGAAFERALPELSKEELHWRLYLSIGVMAQGMRSLHENPLAGGVQAVQDRMIAYLSAGFRARSTR